MRSIFSFCFVLLACLLACLFVRSFVRSFVRFNFCLSFFSFMLCFACDGRQSLALSYLSSHLGISMDGGESEYSRSDRITTNVLRSHTRGSGLHADIV